MSTADLPDRDPTLAAASVTVRYRGSDGYRMSTTYGTMRPLCAEQAKDALLDAHRETARLLSLFGFADEALAIAAEAHEAVAQFFEQRAASPSPDMLEKK